MKTLVLLSLSSLALLSGCAAPEPVIVEQHHYHTRTRTRPVYIETTPVRRSKASPSVSGGSGSAEGFRAVEAPGSYSQ